MFLSVVIGLVHFTQLRQYATIAHKNTGDDPCATLAKERMHLKVLIVQPFQVVIEYYVDFFLLYLLFRFVRPTKVTNKNSDYFGILLSHDHSTADSTIERQLDENARVNSERKKMVQKQ